MAPPTGSKTTSAPRPPVSSRTAAFTSSLSLSSAWSAPCAAGDLELVGAARGGDDRGAHRLAALDRREADAAGRTVDDQRLARVQVGPPAQGAIGRAVGDREAGGGRVVHRRRAAGRRRPRGRPPASAKPPRSRTAMHPLARLEAGDAGAHGLDLARDLEPGRERQRRLLLVLAAQHQGVGEVHARRRAPGSARRRRPAPARGRSASASDLGAAVALAQRWRAWSFPSRPRTSGEHRAAGVRPEGPGGFRRRVLRLSGGHAGRTACAASSRSGPRASASR